LSYGDLGPRLDSNQRCAVFRTAASADLGYEGTYPWQASNLHRAAFGAAASASWATGACDASGGQRSRNLRDVGAALCQLSYAGPGRIGKIRTPSPVYQTGALNHCATIRRVGPQRFELRSACYKQAALPLSYGPYEIGGPERIRTSTAMWRFYRALGTLIPSRPIGAAPGSRTLTACLEGRHACPLRHSSGWSRQ
jgi:hypothetical protein